MLDAGEEHRVLPARHRRGPDDVQPFPAGLMMVAGNAGATKDQPVSIVAWTCGTGSERDVAAARVRARVATCACSSRSPTAGTAPHLDSDDHHAHVAYSSKGACPTGYPVPVPQLQFSVEYPVSGAVAGLELAVGGLISGHADFMNGWDQERLAREVRLCLHREVVCGITCRTEDRLICATLPTMYANIVVGTDGSDTAKIAVQHAMALAQAGGGTLHVVHAYQNVSLGIAAMAAGSGGPTVDLDRLNTGLQENGQSVLDAVLADAAAGGVSAPGARRAGRARRRVADRRRERRCRPHRRRQPRHVGGEAVRVGQRAQPHLAPLPVQPPHRPHDG